MPVAFRDVADVDGLGSAAFLRIVPAADGDAFLGALFLVNGRGEPVEFTYNRLEIVQRFLWRADDLRRHAARRLTASLFEVCPRIPAVILCLAEEAPAELFSEDIGVELPTVRLAEQSAVIGQSALESRELVEGSLPLQIFWNGSIPGEGETARTLVDHLAERGLLLEPFDRALVGLHEVYGTAKDADGLVDRDAAP
ncbi:MAG: hypothetical protein ACYC1P_04150 [Gaiellaceae bacterium]